jgi:hypothetical protein
MEKHLETLSLIVLAQDSKRAQNDGIAAIHEIRQTLKDNIFITIKELDVCIAAFDALRDLVRATNGANINPSHTIGAGMQAEIQAIAERAQKILAEKG